MNPLIFRKGICDPHIHVFEGKAYLYATQDAPGYDEDFRMDNWTIWSSENFIDWKLETIVRPEDFYCGGLNECWAVDAACKNRKYYLYFSTGDWGVGVAVADHPAGPFTDALGKALVDYKTPPVNVPKWDPCVFLDDDGEAYLVVGECRVPKPWDCYLIARLTEDMIHLAEPLRRIEYTGNPCPEDKPSIHKYQGKYYLTHSSYVAVSDSVYGPYRYIGNSGCNIDHGSYFTYRNQTYFASGGMDNPNQYFRASYLTPCHYRKNGEIEISKKMMEYGCGQYDAAWERIEASWYFEAPRDCKKELEDGGFAVELMDGEYLCFPEISNVEENSRIQVWARGEEGATLQIYEGVGQISIEKRLGQISIGTRLGQYEGRFSAEAGKKNLVFYAQGGIELYWFSFSNGKKRFCLNPALCKVGRGASLTFDKDGSNHQVLQNMELRGAAIEGLVDGGKGGAGTLKVPYYCTGKAVTLQVSVNGSIQGAMEFPVTGQRCLGAIPRRAEFSIHLKAGLNTIRLFSAEYQEGALAIDHLLVEAEESYGKVYPAASGVLDPWGNGCWDGLPQWETKIGAFGGRIVKYLNKPGYQVTLQNVDGGPGGEHSIEIHYCRQEKGNSRYQLLVNGNEQKELSFPGTGKDSADGMAILKTDLLLNSGKNTLTIRKNAEEDGGIFVDAIAVLPRDQSRS